MEFEKSCLFKPYLDIVFQKIKKINMSIDYPEFSLFCPCDVMDDTNEINCTNYEVDRFIFDRKTV